MAEYKFLVASSQTPACEWSFWSPCFPKNDQAGAWKIMVPKLELGNQPDFFREVVFNQILNKNMRRVLVIGSGGAGKSTFSAKLGLKLGLPVLHLDAYFWSTGWVESDKAEWRQTVGRLTVQDAWIMDGNYGGTLDIRLAACDTVIFLDRPRLLCLWRVVLRRLRFHGRTRPDMSQGCNEQLTWEFIRYVWGYPSTRKPRILTRLSALSDDKQIIVLKTQRQMDVFLMGLK